MRRFYAGCIVTALAILGGCGPGAPKTTKVSGTVTVDGQPLQNGDVTLVNSNGLPPETLHVKDGSFEGPAKLGKVKVEIRAYRAGKTAAPTTAESTPTPPNYLPARFNSDTTLTAEVTNGGISPSKFDVQSR